MKLASLRKRRDGELVVVDRSLRKAVRVPEIAPTLQQALDDWARAAPRLREVYERLCRGEAGDAFPLEVDSLAAPLPRAYQWVDGSAYLSHVERVRRARGAEMPAGLNTDPLMYQGVSDGFLGPNQAILVADAAYGIDLEAEVAIITDDVPMGVGPAAAARHIQLLVLVNDVSLRNLIPAEVAKGLGFLQGKPVSSLSPVAVTPDELGKAWDGSRAHLPLRSLVNGRLLGQPNPGVDMQFGFPELIAHAARTRALGAGTILGGGTVSNRDPGVGVSCIAEKRVLETLDKGNAETPFLRFGDRVRIEMLDGAGASIFGAIDQEVRRYTAR